MSQEHDHKEFIERLRKSRDIVGYIDPVVVDKNTFEIVVGRHRKEADPNWPEVKKEFKSRKERLLYQIHSDTHRRTVSKKERQTQLLELALHLEDEGVLKEKMASKLAELTGLGLRYVESLLPKKYKETKFASKPKEPELARPPKIVEPEEFVETPTKPSEAGAGFEPAKPEFVETEKLVGAETSVPEPSKPKPPKPKTVTCPYCKEAISQLVCSNCLVGKISVKDLFKDFSRNDEEE